MVGFARTHMRCDLGSYAHPALTINSPPSKQGFKYESKWTVQSPTTSALWALGDWSCAPGECLVALRRGLEGRCAPLGPTAAAGPTVAELSGEAQRGARAPSRGARKLDRRGRQADWRAALSFRAKATDLLQSRPFLRHAIVAHRHCSQLAYHAVRLSIAR